MGVNCVILLPGGARVEDVADVIAALAGVPCERFDVSSGGGWYATNSAANIRGNPTTTMKNVIVESNVPMVDGEKYHNVYYDFEGGPRGERALRPPSTSFWIAVARGLVNFFGGTVDYQDCDDTDVDYERGARVDIHAEDGSSWTRFQRRKLAVKAITKGQFKAASKLAAYKDKE